MPVPLLERGMERGGNLVDGTVSVKWAYVPGTAALIKSSVAASPLHRWIRRQKRIVASGERPIRAMLLCLRVYQFTANEQGGMLHFHYSLIHTLTTFFHTNMHLQARNTWSVEIKKHPESPSHWLNASPPQLFLILRVFYLVKAYCIIPTTDLGYREIAKGIVQQQWHGYA